MDLLVTTAGETDAIGQASAEAAARRHGLPFMPRAGRSLARIAAEASAEALLVLGPRRAALWLDGREHP